MDLIVEANIPWKDPMPTLIKSAVAPRHVLGLPDHLTIDQRQSRLGPAIRPSHRHVYSSRVGIAQPRGRQDATDFDLMIEWPRHLYGGMTAQMKVASLAPDRVRIVVTDRIGPNGPIRATTDLALLIMAARAQSASGPCP
jgi:hypothetical protein